MSKLRSKWPYWPPEEYDLKPLSKHWRPPGYILLSEVVDLVGRARFDEEWSGGELKARPIGTGLPHLPSETEEIVWKANQDGIRRLPTSRLSSGDWRVVTTRGNKIVKSEELACELWKEERPKLLEMWKAEHGARMRYEETVHQLRTDLYDSNLKAWAHHKKVGDLVEIPSHVWGRDGIEATFELANNPVSRRDPNIIKFSAALGTYGNPITIEGRVILSTSEVEIYVKQQDNYAGASGTGTIVAERECELWIRELASRGSRPKTKEALWLEAGQRWGSRLSRRGFERAWGGAAPPEWKRSGRKPQR